jgi:hypothetical protein
MSSVEQPEEPVVRIYTPDEAIRRARPLPARGRLVIEDVSDEEWAAFQTALAGPMTNARSWGIGHGRNGYQLVVR